MTERIKNYLGIVVGIAVLVLAFSALSYVGSYAASIQPSSFRSFSVSGQGKVVVVPDVAKFTFSVITQGGKDIAGLQKDNTDKTNKAIAFVKSQGVDTKDIQTESYSLDPRYQYYACPKDGGACPPQEIVGYTITQTISVKARDFGKVGDILSGVIANGANSVSSLQFTLDNPDAAEGAARAEAIKKAEAKAKTVAEAGGFNLGRLLSIEEGGMYPPTPIYYSKAESFASGLGGAPVPTIEPGSQEREVNVILRYEIR